MTAAGHTPTLSIRDLSVSFVDEAGVVDVVDGVSFDVFPGEIVGLVGESGSGKSTVAQAAMRVLPPPGVITGGSVFFEGTDVLTLDDDGLRALRWTKISWVMQSALDALNPVLRIEAQITDVLARGGLVGAAARARATELLGLVALPPSVLQRYPHELSGGMRQRVAIAMALSLSPSLIVLDEPTTALDVVVERDLLREVLALRARLGFAVLFIGHDLGRIVELADRLVLLYGGRVAEVIDADRFERAARHPYARQLFAAMPSLTSTDAAPGIPGTPPSPHAPPPGCRFHPRCARATEVCTHTAPPLVVIGREAFACHHPHDATTPAGAPPAGS
jgi:peptide/nickel transport system ATP-binding protein